MHGCASIRVNAAVGPFHCWPELKFFLVSSARGGLTGLFTPQVGRTIEREVAYWVHAGRQ
jgi:hypothetical protein